MHILFDDNELTEIQSSIFATAVKRALPYVEFNASSFVVALSLKDAAEILDTLTFIISDETTVLEHAKDNEGALGMNSPISGLMSAFEYLQRKVASIVCAMIRYDIESVYLEYVMEEGPDNVSYHIDVEER